MTSAPADPRPQLAAALDCAQHQIEVLTDADLARPTPCADFDTRTLLAHLVAVLRKLVLVGHGGDMTTVPDPATDDTDDWPGDFVRARAELDRTWSEDARLEPEYQLAWGVMTGRDLLEGYAHEFTVHAWDLAQVTGRGDLLDAGLAAAALEWYTANVPADERCESGPFAPVVEVPAEADAHTRLAGFVGRAVP